jgi:ubiquinone/menaquinone biosynthesis C-methylase UbiE
VYAKSARWYDAIYHAKDYAREALQLHELLERERRSRGDKLLDVACGTGAHLGYLRKHYSVEGLDVDPAMLAIACERHPDLSIHQGDMADFDLGRQFDAVLCLFSSIGYMRTEARLRQTLANMQRHVVPGGLVVVEPWITPENYRPGVMTARFVDQSDLKIARIDVSAIEGDLAVLDFHFLVGTPGGIEHFTERHELRLFTHAQYQSAFEAAGLRVTFDPQGLTGRGLYTGLRESPT